jgi:predicted nucleic acid-binding protein
MKALVDASTLLLLLKHVDERKLADLVGEVAVLDMTAYEASNGIWKQTRLLNLMTHEEALVTQRALVRLLSKASLVRWEELDHAQAMKLAIARRITFYDACYLVAARSLQLPLATEDRKLAAAAEGQKVLGWEDLSSK